MYVLLIVKYVLLPPKKFTYVLHFERLKLQVDFVRCTVFVCDEMN